MVWPTYHHMIISCLVLYQDLFSHFHMLKSSVQKKNVMQTLEISHSKRSESYTTISTVAEFKQHQT